jgi:hypothetical protein
MDPKPYLDYLDKEMTAAAKCYRRRILFSGACIRSSATGECFTGPD